MLAIQEKIYGEDRRELATVHRKLAMLYSALGQKQKTNDFFDKTVKLTKIWISDAEKDGTSADTVKEIKAELAGIYLHAYFAACEAGDNQGQIDKIVSATELQKELKGEDSQEVLSNLFLAAQSQLRSGRFDDALKTNDQVIAKIEGVRE